MNKLIKHYKDGIKRIEKNIYYNFNKSYIYRLNNLIEIMSKMGFFYLVSYMYPFIIEKGDIEVDIDFYNDCRMDIILNETKMSYSVYTHNNTTLHILDDVDNIQNVKELESSLNKTFSFEDNNTIALGDNFKLGIGKIKKDNDILL